MKFKELDKGQKKRLLITMLLVIGIATTYIACAVTTLYKDKTSEDEYWNSYMKTPVEYTQAVEERGQDSIEVEVGTYVENLKEINIKGSSFRASYEIWFKWEGDPELNMINHYRIYKGTINKQEVIKDYHEGNMNYQKVRVDVTVTKDYWTKRFPLESHQLRMYLMSNYPIEKVHFLGDDKLSSCNPNLSITGYDLTRFGTGVTGYTTKSTGDPEIKGDITSSEYMTAIEINRTSAGLYVKCFIALVGTITWVLITLFLCSYHHVDPLSMIPAALFGTVSNIMVGANLLPDALDLGLLEYVNFFGVLSILAVALTVINVNRIRNKYQDKAFASYYGRRMFYILLLYILLGNILMPLAAFIF
ncbi:MAG: hypothetical protein RR441_01525 [Longicatena sp.]